VSSTRIEVPWVDYIPASVVALQVARGAEAAQVGGIVAAPGPNGADVVDSLGDVAADRADVPIPPQDPLT
jgi:hypothetical protein